MMALRPAVIEEIRKGRPVSSTNWSKARCTRSLHLGGGGSFHVHPDHGSVEDAQKNGIAIGGVDAD